jgi:hypothetical protein
MFRRFTALASAMLALSAVTLLAPSAQAVGTAPTAVAGAADAFNYGKPGLLKIAISRDTADGDVQVFDAADNLIGTATVAAGRGTLDLAPKLFKPGSHTVRLEYLGTDFFAPSTGSATFTVLKSTPKVKVRVADTIDKSEGGKARVRVVAPDDIPVRGQVRLSVMGTNKSVTGKLVDAKVTLKLPKFSSVGTFRLKVKYLGSPLLHTAKTIVKVTVVK